MRRRPTSHFTRHLRAATVAASTLLVPSAGFSQENAATEATTEVATAAAKPAEQVSGDAVSGDAGGGQTSTEAAATEVTTTEAVDAILPENPEPEATLVPTDDPNYDLLGEFVGSITQNGETTPLGLQIRPIGNSRFEAIQYTGGVPGKGANTEEVLQLVGSRFGDSLILSGGPYAIFVTKDACSVVSAEGTKLGALTRIERVSPTMGAQPPEGATILFDGSNLENFTQAQMTAEGLLMQGADVKPLFQDFNLHVEFRLPYMPESMGQERGNSGCYLQSRYEVQVLDSFAELPTFNGCSSLYRFKQPDLNMCLPPLRWQTYDIAFTAPRWSADGTKARNGRITVWHNGVKTQDDVELVNKTGAGKPEAPVLSPIRFQNHKDPVRFRNIWIVDRGLVPLTPFPVVPSSTAVEPVSEAEAVKTAAE